MRVSDNINGILENRITRRKIRRINTTKAISTGEPEGAGASDDRHLPRPVHDRDVGGHAQRAPIELPRRYIEVGVQRNCEGLEARVGGRALHPGDLLGADVWRGRDEVVEDIDVAEPGGGGGGDGGVCDEEDGVVGELGAAVEVVDVEMELCDVFVAFGEGLGPRGGGGDGKEGGDYQRKSYW